MTRESPSEIASHRRPIGPYFVLTGCLALTALLTFYAHSLAQAKDEARFERAMQTTKAAMTNRVQTCIELLLAASAFFAGNGEVSAAEFRSFAEKLGLGTRHRGMLGIGFSKRLTPQEKDEFVERIQREVYAKFNLWPEGERPEYHSIIYLEPLNRGNDAAIGYDMFTEAVCREAMERARDTALPAASSRVALKQETEPNDVSQPEFLIYVPVYHGGTAPPHAEERAAALRGFVYAPFRMRELLQGLFPDQSNPGVDFSVSLGPPETAAGILYSSSLKPTRAGNGRQYTRREVLPIAGQAWKLSFATNEHFAAASDHSSAPLVCLGGLVISFALFGFTYAQTTQQLAAERHAEQLRKSKAQLQESEQRFRIMADQAPVMIWTSGPDKLCNYFNKPWLDFTGRALEQELGNGWAEGVHDDDRQRCLDTYVRAFDALQEFKIEYRLRRFDRQFRWVLAQGAPLFGGDGKLVGYIGSCIDITDRKNSEEAIQKLNADLEGRVAKRTAALRESHEQMESFTYSVAHDLRAPLRAMQGFAAALAEDYGSDLDEQGKDFTHRIMAAAQRMDALIQDLLAYSRISRTPLVLEKVRLEKTIEAVLPLFELDIKRKRATVKVEHPLPEVTGHGATIETILTNLLSNALKFVRNGARPHVRIWAEEKANMVRLWVEDNGIGISPQYQERIFKVFERLHGSDAYPGTGIGLAVVRKGVERMGGSVGLESEAGKGSRFWIELPKEGTIGA